MNNFKRIALITAGVAVLAGGALLGAVQVLAQEDPRRKNVIAQERLEPVGERTHDRMRAIKAQIEARKTEVKKQVCEQRQQRLQQRIPRLATSANVLKNNFDKIYTRVQGFYEKGQLTVSNYDALKAAVDAAQADAAVSVEALNDYKFTLDCDNPDAGQKLDGFRQMAKLAKEDLKEYRRALVDLISAMRSASAEQKDQNNQNGEGGSSNE